MNDKEMKASLPKPEKYSSKTRKHFSSKSNVQYFIQFAFIVYFQSNLFKPFSIAIDGHVHFPLSLPLSLSFFQFCCFLPCVSASVSFKWLNCLLRIQVFFLADYFKPKLVLSRTVEFQMSP